MEGPAYSLYRQADSAMLEGSTRFDKSFFLLTSHNSQPSSLCHNQIFQTKRAMTRVANAAAITLQTWSRTVLSKIQVDARLQQAQQRKSLEMEKSYSRPAGMEVWTRRALLLAACFALVGMNLQGGSTQEVMATSSNVVVNVMVKESSRSLTQGLFGLVSEAVPSLLYSSRRG
jgi:hypothetical protein